MAFLRVPTLIPLLVLLAAFAAHSLPTPAVAEAPPGFTSLFNGTDLGGWKGLVGNPKTRAAMSQEELSAAQKKADENMRAHWKVEDGVLVFDGKGQSLCTDKDYGDFELYVDWKILERRRQRDLPPRQPAGADLGHRIPGLFSPRRGKRLGGVLEQPRQPAVSAGQSRQARRRVEHVLHSHGRRTGDHQTERSTGRRQCRDGKPLGTQSADLSPRPD